MSNSMGARLGRALRGVWWFVDTTRRTLMNLLLLLLLALLAAWLLRGGVPPLQDKTALVLALRGPLVEQNHASSRDSALRRLQGGGGGEQTRLRDVLAALDAAREDPHISHAVLLLDEFAGAGLPGLREVAAAMQRFQAAGKPVLAWGSGFDQRQYFLAAHASQVWLHPMGEVTLTGMGSVRSYYKGLLDKLGVTAHVMRAGAYKNAAENLVASGPSPATLEADKLLYDGLWATWTNTVEGVRKLPAGHVNSAIAAWPERLAAVGGDSATLALQEKWVDALKTRDEMRAALVERGARDEDEKTFRQVHFEAYLSRVKPRTGTDAVAVVVAEGAISDGAAPAGRIGGLSTGELIRRAREDEHIKAVVLRVDSPGGSAFGSELVRRELALTRAAGKPVVVSMGDVAASGGYWVALAADEVFADVATITGSIGVVAVLPSAERGAERLGLATGGYRTGWPVGAYDVRSGLDPRMAKVIQAGVDHAYFDFTTKAAAARNTTREKIDAVAQGRVWTGEQALARGLVDKLGSFGDALAAAATRAKLPAQHRIVYLERERGRLDTLLGWLGEPLSSLDVAAWLPVATALPAALAPVQEDMAWLLQAASPGLAHREMTHCLCAAP